MAICLDFDWQTNEFMPLVFGTVIKETVSDGLFFIQSSSRRVLSRCNREYVTVS